MTYEFSKEVCYALGVDLAAQGIRLDSPEIKGSVHKDRNKASYYLVNNVAFKASYVVSGYWDTVNAAKPVETTTAKSFTFKR